MTIDSKVELITEGENLLGNLELLDPISSWQTGAEVFKDWQAGAKVIGVNTANMTYYRIDSGDALIDLVDREGNLFLDDRFRKDTYTGIRDNAFFFLTPEMKKQVMDTAITPKKSAQVKYSELNVKTDNCGPAYCYIEANDDNTDGEKRLFAAAYGKENPGNGRRFYLLRENVVKAQLRGREGDMFARACYLDNDLNFSADDRDINNAYGGVRGVRRVVVAEGDEAKKVEYNNALDIVTGNPEMLTPDNAPRLANLLTQYLSRQKQ